MTATIGTLAGKQTDPVGPPRVKRNRQSARPRVRRTPFYTTLLEELPGSVPFKVFVPAKAPGRRG